MILLLSMSGIPIIICMSLIVFSVLGLIYLMKWIYARKSNTILAADQGRVEERNKFAAVNVFKLQGTFFNFGLVIALAIIVMAFNWTKYDNTFSIPDQPWDGLEDIDMLPPRTMEKPLPPPPPPPPVIEEVPEEEILEEDEVEFISNDIDETTEVIAPAPPVKKELPPAPVFLPEPEPDVDEIFVRAEEMPRFPGCEELNAKAEKQQCADRKLLEFIYKNIKYPAIARENGIEGTCVIQFVVDKNGQIKDAKAVRDIGAQCGQEALRVVNLMNEKGITWTPGKQRGRAVNVQFSLPIKFRLE